VQGDIAKALMGKAEELFSSKLLIPEIQVIASKQGSLFKREPPRSLQRSTPWAPSLVSATISQTA
jgi:hypothetical protein